MPQTIKAEQATARRMAKAIANGSVLAPNIPAKTTIYKDPLTPVEVGFGYQGVLSSNEEGTHLQCHECGHFFINLTRHLRVHEMSVADYRDKYELSAGTSLMSEEEQKRHSVRWFDQPVAEQEAQKNRLFQANARAVASSIASRSESKRTAWTLEKRNKQGTCPDQLAEKLGQLAEKLGHTPTADDFTDAYGRGPLKTLLYYFGKYTTAVKAMGLTPKGYAWRSSEVLLDSIIEFRANFGREPVSSDFISQRLAGSRNTYYAHFGDLENARRQATLRSIGLTSKEEI